MGTQYDIWFTLTLVPSGIQRFAERNGLPKVAALAFRFANEEASSPSRFFQVVWSWKIQVAGSEGWGTSWTVMI